MSINISQALNSANYAKKVWINYYYGENTVGASASDIGKITSQWSSKISSWKDFAETMDENDYKLTEEDLKNYKDDGKDETADKIGYSNSRKDKNTRNGHLLADGVGAAGGLVCGITSAINTGGIVNEGVTLKKPIGKSGTGNTTAYVAAGLAIYTAAQYFIGGKANKREVDALGELKDVMTELQTEGENAQNDLELMDSELIDAADHAEEVSETANETMSDSKAYYDYNASVIKYFESAKTAGYEFTEDDIAMYEESLAYMEEMNATVSTTQDEADTEINDTYSNMESYQDGFDEVAETAGMTEGATDFAAEFDDATNISCRMEATSQFANAASGLLAAAQLLGLGWWNAILAAASAAAGITSAANGAEQIRWLGKTDEEIKERKATQEVNDNTKDSYEEYYENYDSYKDDVENIELVVPDEMEVPEVEVPTVGVNGGGETEGDTGTEDNTNPKKPKETENG